MAEMTIERVTSGASGEMLKLEIGGPVTIAQAALFKEELLKALEQAGEVRLDLTKVTEMDLTPLQLICAAHGSARELGKRVTVDYGGSEVYRRTVSDAGFQSQVGCLGDASHPCIWVGGEC